MKRPIPLTASQIRTFEEIGIDKQSLNLSLRSAMQYHSNASNALLKREKKSVGRNYPSV